MKNKYLEVAKIIKNSISQTKDEKLKEYLARTAISRAYEAVFLELFYYFTEDLKISYTELKTIAKDYYKQKGIKISINKHTVVGAYMSLKYGEIYGKMFEDLRLARNDVDYNLILQYVDIAETRKYIKKAEIISQEVIKEWLH